MPGRDAQPRPADRGIADEIGMRGDFADPAHEADLNLIRTADQLAAEHAKLFAEHGLSSPLYNILRILRGHERHGAPEGVPAYTVARQMVTRVPDITRLADRLEKLGLAERARCAEDRRVVRLRLTDAGRERVDGLAGPVLALTREQFGHLSEREVRTLSRLLTKLRRRPDDGQP